MTHPTRKCPSCGVLNPMSNESCEICGKALAGVAATQPVAQTPPAEASVPVAAAPGRSPQRSEPGAATPDVPVAATRSTPSKSVEPRTRRAVLLVVGLLVLLAAIALAILLATRGDDDGFSDDSDDVVATAADRTLGTVPETADTEAPATEPVESEPELTVDEPATTSEPLDTAPPTTIPGDLQLPGRAMTRPPCDGRYITVVRSVVTPGLYAQEVGEALTQYPRSEYLRTDETCSSLRAAMDDGSAIYVVYYGPFATATEACDNRTLGGGDAYVKVLDTFTPSRETFGCP